MSLFAFAAAVPTFCASMGVDRALRTVCFGTGSMDGLIASTPAEAGESEVLLAVRGRGGGGNDGEPLLAGDPPLPALFGSSLVANPGDRKLVVRGSVLRREPGTIARPILAGLGSELGLDADPEAEPETERAAGLASAEFADIDTERWLGGGVGSGIDSMLSPTALCNNAFRHASSSASSVRGGSASASAAAPILLSTPSPPKGVSEDWTGNRYAGRSTVSVGSIKSTAAAAGFGFACGGSRRRRSSSRARMSTSAALAAVTRSSRRSRMTSTRPRRSFSRKEGAVESGAGDVAIRMGSGGRTTGLGAAGALAIFGDSGALFGVRGRPTRKRSRKVGDGVLLGGRFVLTESRESSEWLGLEWAGGRK